VGDDLHNSSSRESRLWPGRPSLPDRRLCRNPKGQSGPDIITHGILKPDDKQGIEPKTGDVRCFTGSACSCRCSRCAHRGGGSRRRELGGCACLGKGHANQKAQSNCNVESTIHLASRGAAGCWGGCSFIDSPGLQPGWASPSPWATKPVEPAGKPCRTAGVPLDENDQILYSAQPINSPAKITLAVRCRHRFNFRALSLPVPEPLATKLATVASNGQAMIRLPPNVPGCDGNTGGL